MGVLGLTPFLQKTCPEVFRSLPQRLRDITGKTVVIDGTLITQRLHFAPSPHPYRHVLNWHRIAQELRDAKVGAICIFDGKSRSIAKQGEMERRREARRLVTTRGQLEADRLQRLCKLVSYVEAWHNLDPKAQETTTRALKELVREPIPSPQPSYTSGNLDLDDYLNDPRISPERDAGVDDQTAYGPFKEADVSEVLTEYSNVTVRPSSESTSGYKSDSDDDHAVIIPKSTDVPIAASDAAHTFLERLSLEDTEPARIEEAYEVVDELSQEGTTVVGTPPRLPSDNVKSALSSAYLEYRASLAQHELLSQAAAAEQQVALPKEDVSETNTDVIMSKTQHQLTVEEGKFWSQLAESSPFSDPGNSAASLAEKSSLLCVSYERRTHPPTEETYQESMEILQAMGIPCVECEGPFEAEALASSLVLNGLADFVASEDTDVIVYGAPLVRNLTRRDEPLVVVSGKEVRTSLELDQKRFVDFALLLGTDFSQRIKNVGPKRALKFIREYGTIEQILEHETRYPPRTPPAIYLEQVTEARQTFANLPPTPDATQLQPLPYDEEEVHKVLRRYGLGRAILTADWDYVDALAGNYFQDDPSVPGPYSEW